LKCVLYISSHLPFVKSIFLQELTTVRHCITDNIVYDYLGKQ